MMSALVARAQAGDANAISAIYARYAEALARFILRNVGDRLIAEDLLQDVFVRMLAGLSRYQDRGYPISTWLYRIARCRVIDWQRASAQRRVERLDHVAEVLLSEPGPDGEQTAADREATQRELALALAQLTPRQAAVIRLRFVAELPGEAARSAITEVAQRLGLTPSMVKALQHRGLATLRRRLITQGTYHPAEAA
jgi:RNA polymerase sigma-70 factor (ECF subfamily)